MASSLRLAAAKRILRPAVLPGQGPRRLVHTEQINRSSRLGTDEYRESVIQRYKEQLYDVIADAHPDSMAFARNSSLLKDLSTQIKPRPHDPQWRKIKRRKTVNKWIEGVASVGILAASALTYCVLTSIPKLGKYEGYIVTEESLPLLRRLYLAERWCKQDEHRAVATAEGVHEHDHGLVTSPHCSRCGNFLPERCAHCGLNLPRPQ
ncbi:hypothetical protein ACQJBY_067165 [Aegilops geniculata]